VIQQQPTAPLSRPEALTLGGLAAMKVAVHLASTPGYGIFRDEYYYLACARHLDWGYVDHPPLSIALLALLTGLFGDSVWTLRIPMALMGALTVVLTGLIARRLGGGLFAVALAGLAALVAPTLLGISAYFSMNSLDLFFWACAVYVLVGILRDDRPQGWLLFGLIAGLGLMNKFSMAFLGFGVVAGLLLTPYRKHFLDWRLYAGGCHRAGSLPPESLVAGHTRLRDVRVHAQCIVLQERTDLAPSVLPGTGPRVPSA
jgi:hypothetical protein